LVRPEQPKKENAPGGSGVQAVRPNRDRCGRHQYAKEHGKGNEYNRRILEAFSVEGQDIGQIGMLTKLAAEVGLDEKEFEEALGTRKYREAHRRSLRHAYEEAGVTGVPMFVIGEQVLTGLQDRETLEAVIEEDLTAAPSANPSGHRAV
jgi:predicted DsbA family dithiol-disulfide isomerase